VKHAIHATLVTAIEESFGPFLRQHAFQHGPNDLSGWGADHVAIYDGPSYRLIFEFGRGDEIRVVARALDDRLRGGALDFVLSFLSGSDGNDFVSLRVQAKNLAHYHSSIADLLAPSHKERYRLFAQWVETNWTRLTDDRDNKRPSAT
jgi:hypothetical protein